MINTKYAKTRSPYAPHTGLVWAKLWLRGLDELGRSGVSLPLPFRIYLIGLGRLGSNGHAPIAQGDLLLAKPDGVVYTARAVQIAIKRLVNAGLLAPSSTRRCLVYPSEHVDFQLSNGSTCPECGHSQRWSIRYGGEWAPSLVAWTPPKPDQAPA